MLVSYCNGSHDELHTPAGKPTTRSSLHGDGGGVAASRPVRHLCPDPVAYEHATGRRRDVTCCNDSSCCMGTVVAACDAAAYCTAGGSW